jgi:putative DNA primase/helicase
MNGDPLKFDPREFEREYVIEHDAPANPKGKPNGIGEDREQEQISTTEEACPPAFTDEALALRFADQHETDLRYVAAWSRWFHYDGQCWRVDNTLLAFDLARRICREAAAGCNKKNVANALASAKTVAAVERLTKADRRLAATIDQWDADPWLLNTPAGVIDLQTGKLRPHRPGDYFTKITAVAPSAAGCPRWKAQLNRILNNEVELISYLQRVLGYSLTGETTEQALFFAYGTGANGKGVTINTVAGILKDYAQTATAETFTASFTDRHTTELAALRGARLVTVGETEEGRRWAESRIKALTGGDPIRARFMRQDEFEFMPQLKLLISGNHKPGLRSVDEAMRRRFHLIPFVVTIPEEERDPNFANTLKDEWPAILTWMIEGCLMWQLERLKPPAAVRDATAAYLEAQDALAAWLEECCECAPHGFETRAALFDSWTAWATSSGEHVGTRARFLDALEERARLEPAKSHGTRGFRGVRIIRREAASHWSES